MTLWALSEKKWVDGVNENIVKGAIKMSRLATIWSEVLGANKRIYSTIPVSLAKVW